MDRDPHTFSRETLDRPSALNARMARTIARRSLALAFALAFASLATVPAATAAVPISPATAESVCALALTQPIPNFGAPGAILAPTACPIARQAATIAVAAASGQGAQTCVAASLAFSPDLCERALMGQGSARATYTQTTLSCTSDGRTCTYQPMFHVAANANVPGHWIMRGTTWLRSGPVTGTWPVVPGSQKTLACEFDAMPEITPNTCSA